MGKKKDKKRLKEALQIKPEPAKDEDGVAVCRGCKRLLYGWEIRQWAGAVLHRWGVYQLCDGC